MIELELVYYLFQKGTRLSMEVGWMRTKVVKRVLSQGVGCMDALTKLPLILTLPVQDFKELKRQCSQ